MLKLEDEHGGDEKLICVPVDTTFPYYSDVGERQDLPSIVLQQIEHFFTHYKDLEADKWVRVGKWGDAADARRIVARGDRAGEGGEGLAHSCGRLSSSRSFFFVASRPFLVHDA